MGAGEQLEAHSPLGASGAYRWLVCPGSVAMSEGVQDDESEFAAEGSVAHALAEICLVNKWEPWTYIGKPADPENYPDINVNKEMADCVQLYIDAINDWHPNRHQGNCWVERKFHSPHIHQYFYGTSDLVYLDERDNVLHIWDYKHGAGIVVEADNNPQAMYYVAGILEDLNLWNTVDTIVIHIFQPRGWHIDGIHRTWEVDTDHIDEWIFDTCVPGMEHALVSRDTIAGEHCRFCPAKGRQCPSIMDKMAELEELLIMADKKGAEALTNEQIGRIMDLQAIAKIVFKDVSKQAYGKLSNGVEIPGLKLVKARSNRTFKDGADKAAKKEFGKRCMTDPVLKSPAQIEGLPGGKEFTARWAFKPEGKLTVAVEGDPRRRVNRDAKSLFTKKGK